MLRQSIDAHVDLAALEATFFPKPGGDEAFLGRWRNHEDSIKYQLSLGYRSAAPPTSGPILPTLDQAGAMQ